MLEQYSEDMEKLKEFDKRLRESTNMSKNVKDYEGIIEFSKMSIETKELGAELIPRYFQYYTSHSKQAFDAYKYIIEAVDLRIRVKAIRKLPLFCKDAPEFVSKIIDVLVLCLDIDQQEQRDAVHETFMSLFQQDTLPDLIKKLPEPRKFDMLKSLAEISPHTTAQVALEMLPSIVQLLKNNMPSRKTLEKSDSRYVECLLYVFHHMAHKVPVATNSLCGYTFMTKQPSDRIGENVLNLYKEFTERLTDLEDLIKASMEQLVQEMSDHDKANLHSESFSAEEEANLYDRRQNTKTKLRTCINILAMTEILHAEAPSFIGDTNVVNLSWKEATKPLAFTRTLYTSAFSSWDTPPNMDALCSLLEDDEIFPLDLLDKLESERICELENLDCVVRLLGLAGFQQAKETVPEGKFVLHEGSQVSCLLWKTSQSKLLKFLTPKSWKGVLGCIRDQLYHILCWAYVASDLVSGTRFMHNLEVEYNPLCPWYLCAFCHRECLGLDESAGEGHYCYANSVEDALLYIKEYGIPREICKEFDCDDYEPPNADDPQIKKRKIKSIRTIHSIEEALLLVPQHPIGADLIVFQELWREGKEIYYGPRPRSAGFQGYHGVIIIGIELYKGEVVAVCKMSNGTRVADKGYVRVSLATMYMVVGVTPEIEKYIRATPKPMHLLSNFVIVDIDEE